MSFEQIAETRVHLPDVNMRNQKVILGPIPPGLDFAKVYGYPQSRAIEAGGLIFLSAMVAVNPQTGEREHGSVTSETHRIFGNIRMLLDGFGSSLSRIVRVHAMIYSRLEYDVLNRVYRQYLPKGAPARMVWDVVIESGFKVQLDVIAGAGRQEIA
jgi:2-iminobutanoate/2-iminopropanoate deaminase